MESEYIKKYEPIFGSWHIVRTLGEGSFGTVFEINRNDFGRTYTAALKAISIPKNEAELQTIIDDGYTKETANTYLRDVVDKLVDEFTLMSELKGNTNIVSYEDHAVYPHENGIGWDIIIRMELLTPLTAYTKDKDLSEKEIIKIGKDICRALELCSKRDIIHRDIKPENIFVNDNGDFKLGDFGIARQVEKTQTGLTKTGTPTYMAPEVYRGDAYGAQVDIYSLGIVLYKMLNHNRAPFYPPFPAPISYNEKELALRKRLDGDPLPLPDGNVSKELCDIVLKACAFNPEDRFATAEEFRHALENIGKQPEQKQDVKPEQKTEPEDFDKTMNVFHAAKTDNSVAGIPVDTSTASKPKSDSNARQIPAKKTKKPFSKKLLLLIIIAAIIVIGGIVAGVVMMSGTSSTGTCGTNLTWELDSEGTLYIDGSGKMYDYVQNGHPWNGKKVKKIVIDKNVTHIGSDAFSYCDNLTTVTIPASVKTVGKYAFASCPNLEKVLFKNSDTKISPTAFSDCSKDLKLYGYEKTSKISEYANTYEFDYIIAKK